MPCARPAFPVKVPELYTSAWTPRIRSACGPTETMASSATSRPPRCRCGGGVPRLSFRAQSPSRGWGVIRPPASTFQVLQAHRARPLEVHLGPADGEGLRRRPHHWVDQRADSRQRHGGPDGLSTAVAGITPTFDVAAAGFTDTTRGAHRRVPRHHRLSPQLCWDLSCRAPSARPSPGWRATRSTAAGHRRHRQGLVRHQLRQHHVLHRPGAEHHRRRQPGHLRELRRHPPARHGGVGEDGNPVPAPWCSCSTARAIPSWMRVASPASAVSAADGTVEFPVWCGGYTLKLNGAANTPRSP